jgi:hypothetical protein
MSTQTQQQINIPEEELTILLIDSITLEDPSISSEIYVYDCAYIIDPSESKVPLSQSTTTPASPAVTIATIPNGSPKSNSLQSSSTLQSSSLVGSSLGNSRVDQVNPISVKITDIKYERSTDNKKIVVFQFFVSEKGPEWTVFRTMDSFNELYKQLIKDYRSKEDEGLVPSLSILNQSSVNNTKIFKYLTAWLAQTLSNPILGNCPLFKEFFQATNISAETKNHHEGYIHKLEIGIDGADSIYWKKAKWHVMKDGVIYKYQMKGDKHPYGAKLVLSGVGGIVQSSEDQDILRIAESSVTVSGVVYPFYLLVSEGKTKDKRVMFAALSENDRWTWLSSVNEYFTTLEKNKK